MPRSGARDRDGDAMTVWTLHEEGPLSFLHALDRLLLGQLPVAAILVRPADVCDALVSARAVRLMDALDLNTGSHLFLLDDVGALLKAPLWETDAFWCADDRTWPRLLARHVHHCQLATDISHGGTNLNLLGEHTREKALKRAVANTVEQRRLK